MKLLSACNKLLNMAAATYLQEPPLALGSVPIKWEDTAEMASGIR